MTLHVQGVLMGFSHGLVHRPVRYLLFMIDFFFFPWTVYSNVSRFPPAFLLKQSSSEKMKVISKRGDWSVELCHCTGIFTTAGQAQEMA